MSASGKASEERLRVEAAREDPSRFAALYEEHFDRVYAYAVRRVGSRDAAEDVTSEVFQRALANIARFEWRGAPFAAWLFRIAANAIADRARRVAREAPLVGETPAPDPPPERIEESARLFRLVRTLPEDQRRVIELRFGEQRSIREVAVVLGRSEGAVKQLQLRGLRGLRERMGRADA